MPSCTISFRVNTAPVAQPRHRVGAGFGGKPHAYLPKSHPVHAYKALVRAQARLHHHGKPLEGPLRLFLKFGMPRPKSMIWKKKPMPEVPCDRKPDNDNLCKSLFDALSGVCYLDDAQLAEVRACKVYVAGNTQPYVEVLIATWD
jgi:Holliday junction resolvase RusA-like endonuclease